MNRYIGIDAHDKSCSLAVFDEKGSELRHAVLETNGALIRDFVKEVPRARHVALEEGILSEWLYELIEPLAEEVVVFVPPKRRGPKDDLRDARSAAEAIRTRSFQTTVYKPDRELADLRSAVRGYQVVRQDLTRAKLRLNAAFRSRAVQPGQAIYDSVSREAMLKLLPEPERRLAELLGHEVDELQKVMSEASHALKRVSAKYPAVKRLETAPGIGTVRAATIVAVVGSPHRFRSVRQYWAYCGLAIVRRSTSDWRKDRNGTWQRVSLDKTRGLNFNRNHWLKDVYKGAATGLIMRSSDHPLVELYRQRLANGIKPNMSALTLARQISAITLAMWKNEEDYDPTRRQISKTTAS